MELREIIAALRKLGIKPRKSLSQVFLVSEVFLRSIAREARRALDREVIELGAGPGNLTKYLLDEGLEVVAIEIDHRFAPILKALMERYPRLHPVIGDAIHILRSCRASRNVVGNVPYHISSDILVEIVRSGVERALITVQKEVADRLLASPGCKSYGRLSVLIQLAFDVELKFVIPPTAFIPRPEVFSATLFLKRKRHYDEVFRELENVTRCLFSYRNKLLRKALRRCFGDLWSELWNLLKIEGVDEGVRVYQLEPANFLSIARTIVDLRKPLS